MPRILVADDHGLYRKGLRSTLEAAITNSQILEADSFEAALAEIEAGGSLDLALLDLNMGGQISFKTLRRVRESCPRTRFLILSASDARSDVLNSLASGLHGFVSKLQPEQEIIQAVKHVLCGCIYVPPWLSQVHFLGSNQFANARLLPYQSCEDSFAKLTPRQKDVLPLLAKGLSNKEIARVLNITEATTKIHVAGLCRVLGVRNRTEAAWATRTFIAQPEITA